MESKYGEQYIVVRVAESFYGINIQQIQNIDRLKNITRVPKSPKHIKGVINLRGEIIPVMSLRMRFNMEEKNYDHATRVIIVNTHGENMGIIVDEVKEVMTIDDSIVENASGMSKIDATFIKGVAKLEKEILILLNLEGLIEQYRE